SQATFTIFCEPNILVAGQCSNLYAGVADSVHRRDSRGSDGSPCAEGRTNVRIRTPTLRLNERWLRLQNHPLRGNPRLQRQDSAQALEMETFDLIENLSEDLLEPANPGPVERIRSTQVESDGLAQQKGVQSFTSMNVFQDRYHDRSRAFQFL